MEPYVQLARDAVEDLLRGLFASLPRILVAMFLFAIIVWLASLAQRIAARAIRQTQAGAAVERLVSQVVYYGLIVIGAIMALAEAGIDVTTVIAGLGLTGFAVGLALKDTIENLISGVMLLIQRPFVLGDTIVVEGQEGEVVDISIRTTRLRTADALEVIIPNAKVFNDVLINKSRYAARRFGLQFAVAPGASLDAATQAVLGAIRTLPEVLPEPAPQVTWKALDATRILADLHYWAEPRAAQRSGLPSRVLQAIQMAAAQAGIQLA